jgi:hypothetical protein
LSEYFLSLRYEEYSTFEKKSTDFGTFPDMRFVIKMDSRLEDEVTMMTLQDIMREAETLSAQERRELIKMLVDTLSVESPAPKHSLKELRGLGKEIWQGIDAQKYVDQMRDEWDNRQ